MPRARDFGFEALVEVTGANVAVERGAINSALKAIKEALGGEVDGELLGEVITDMAGRYRKLWPDMTLTPTALAKHWNRILAEETERAKPTTYVYDAGADGVFCTTCEGLRMVLVGHQQPKPTSWHIEQNKKLRQGKPPVGFQHPDHRKPTDGHEIYMPCPDCNAPALGIVRQYRDRFARQHG
jgi:hypothetical protein